MWTMLVAMAGLLYAAAVPQAAAANMLLHSDFEGAEARRAWHGDNVQVVAGTRPGGTGQSVLRVDTDTPVWRMAKEEVVVPTGARHVWLRGWARGEKLTPPPDASWRCAQLQLGFHDEGGRLIGEWVGLNLPLGDSPWRFYQGEFDVPPASRTIVAFLGNNHVSGTSWFDDVTLEALDAGGKGLQPVTESRTDTTGWFALDAAPDDYGAPAVADLSRLLDAPAGKHAFVTVKDGHFAFEDGTRVRFWGVNVGAGDCFPDRVTAERTAARFAKFGVNMVRFHHMDAAWARPNIFNMQGNTYGQSTRQLSPESLDRVDYFIAELKQRGIYVYMDLLVHRHPSEEDLQGLEHPDSGMKMVAHFNERLIQLQKEYAAQLLTHRNPYTGLRYVDDPVVAMMEVTNESSLFWFGAYDQMPQGYQQELEQKFDAWCAASGRPRPPGGVRELVHARNAALMRFLYDTQAQHFVGMWDFLRSIGVRVPVAGSNFWENSAGDLLSNARLDYIDRHTYWDHPRGGYDPWCEFDNRPMVRSPLWSPPDLLSCTRMAGMPFIVTEWNNCWPNEYITEGPAMMAAYGAFQDWDGLLQFVCTGGDWLPKMEGVFNTGNKPHVMAARVPSALIFLRGDVDAGAAPYVRPLAGTDGELAQDVTGLFPRGAGLVRRVAARLRVPEGTPPSLRDGALPVFPAEGGQLHWDGAEGTLVINTPRTQGAVGFIGRRPKQAADLRIEAETRFCQVILTSLDGEPLSASRRMLLTATARAENTGQVYRPLRDGLVSEGSAPVLIEPVVATLTVSAGGEVRVHVLDHRGRRTGRNVPVSSVDGGVRFGVGSEAAFWYEVER